jgi:hypothetical protein
MHCTWMKALLFIEFENYSILCFFKYPIFSVYLIRERNIDITIKFLQHIAHTKKIKKQIVEI